MRLSGPERTRTKTKVGDALLQESLPEPVFQFDPLIEISPRAWEVIDRWKESNVDVPLPGRKAWEESERFEKNYWHQFFYALTPAVALKLMNPGRYTDLNGVRGKVQADLPPDLVKRQTPSFFETGLLCQLYTSFPATGLYDHQHRMHPDAKSVFGRALVERQRWNEAPRSEKRYWEQPVVIDDKVRRFTEGHMQLEELALYAAVIPELHERLAKFHADFQTAGQAFRRKLAFAMRNQGGADWREIIQEAFTLTLLGSDTELTDKGLVIKKRNSSTIKTSPTLPERSVV